MAKNERMRSRGQETIMIDQKTKKSDAQKLHEKRELLRSQLKKHFLTPVTERNYPEFEKLVAELDNLRQRIHTW